jgi:hypothetical protein
MLPFTGPRMDLANMRSLGVTAVDVYCGFKPGSSSSVGLDFDAFPDGS